ncbi:hypothetical protein Sjap_005559 [Stephania japonica]|uniref:Bidirectional sugar transporter SWEET n=1 Tax=Stephania japonica TaxID=461633 RepID=A0AAP0K4G8_9MAGN
MVSADALRTAVGILGNIIALGLFLSPTPTFIKICKKGTVEQFSPTPYLSTLLNCMFWVLYGLPLVHPHSILVITINGTGLVIELIYVVLFIVYSDGRKRLRVAGVLVGEVVFVGVVALLVLTLVHTHERRSLVVGALCVFFGTMIVEYMPFFLSFASFINGLCWTCYALIRFDLFITIPNGLGSLFGLAQLILYATFYKSTRRQLEAMQSKGQVAVLEAVVVGESNKVSGENGQNGGVFGTGHQK